jgi:hypothetical protein
MRLRTLETVESLTSTSRTRRKHSRLCGKVAAGRSFRSASKSFLTASSSLGLDPGRFLGASDLPCWRAVATQRFTEEMPTPKVLAASILGILLCTASTIFFFLRLWTYTA